MSYINNICPIHGPQAGPCNLCNGKGLPYIWTTQGTATISTRQLELEAENERLKVLLEVHKAELDKLKPKPDIDELEIRVWLGYIDDGGLPIPGADLYAKDPNVRFTFTNGVLTSAEVIGEKG
jgi:hypothetical protein